MLHILNLEDLLTESNRLSALYKCGDKDALYIWDVALRLRLKHKGKSYDGEASSDLRLLRASPVSISTAR